MAIDLTGGIPLSWDEVLIAAPEDPDFREAANIWLHDDEGRFSLPRIGVEAVGRSWDRRGVHANMAFPDGRVLTVRGEGDARGPYDTEGRPALIGAGPIEFRCLKPFERWTMSFRGNAEETTISDQVAAKTDRVKVADRPPVDVEITVDMTMVVPPWVRGRVSDDARSPLDGTEEARFIGGIGGQNIKQLFRATGAFRVGSDKLEFNGTGLRVHRQGVRDTTEMRGHCWQSAVFPSGKAFEYLAFPDHPDGTPSYSEGYLFDGERRFLATVVEAPWMRSFQPHGGDVSLVLRSEVGDTKIYGETHTSTATAGADLAYLSGQRSARSPNNLFFHQGSARYTWDGETIYGMVERSYPLGEISL